MPYIGSQPSQVAFLTDSFNGNGSTTAFTMSVAPANSASILIAISGVTQAPSVYSVVGTTLTFSTAPPSGTANISVRYLGIPASGVTTTAYRTLTEFTATASQTTFTPPSYTVGFIAVYQNGVMLGSTDYTATNGTTVVLAVGALVNDLISTESFYVSSVLNALPVTGGTISGNLVVTGTASITGVTTLTGGLNTPLAVTSGGTGVATSTGSGANVLGTSPTLVTPALGTPASGVLTNCTGVARAALPAGSVLQVVSATKTDTFTSAVTATWTDITGISVAITPTLATSKIFLMCTVQGAIYRPGTSAVMLRLVRDSTAIGIGDAASNRTRMTFGASVVSNDSIASTTVNYLDSPATTSSTTYKVQFFQSSATIQINRTVTDADASDNGRSISSITVMEIAG